MSAVIKSDMTTRSTRMSQAPRFIRKSDISFFDLRLLCNHADRPERNIKAGAQKCVTHLVKKSGAVVVSGFNGSPVNAPE